MPLPTPGTMPVASGVPAGNAAVTVTVAARRAGAARQASRGLLRRPTVLVRAELPGGCLLRLVVLWAVARAAAAATAAPGATARAGCIVIGEMRAAAAGVLGCGRSRRMGWAPPCAALS